MVKRPKQLRMDDEHLRLLTILRSFTRSRADNAVGAMAVRCLAEQVGAAFAAQGNTAGMDALLPLLCQAAQSVTGPVPYTYDPERRELKRWVPLTGYVPIPLAFIFERGEAAGGV